MKTSEYPVWLVVPHEAREAVREAAGTLPNGRSAIAWDKDEKLWFAKPGCDLDRVQDWLPDRSIRAGGGDPESEFLDVLTQAGLVIKGMPVMDGQRHRVSTTDDKSGKKSGVYCGFLDRRPAGWFINYHRADTAKDVTNWVSTGGEADPVARLHIRAAAKQSQEDSARERAAIHAERTQAAQKLYDRLPAADPSHPYLVRKGITPTPEIRQTRNGALVVPFFNAQGNFKTLQYIPEAGEKLLFKDAPKQGHFLVVGGPLEAGQPIQYAEGYATARSLNIATGRPVVMTIDAGNMVAVAQILHQQFPDSPHLFMADFDHTKEVNKGLLMANEAAALVGGQVLYPAFNEAEMAQGYTDFNDLHQSRGLEAVRDQTAHLFKRNDEVPTVPDEQTLEPMDPAETTTAKPAAKRAAKTATAKPADKPVDKAAGPKKPTPKRAPRTAAAKSAASDTIIENPPALGVSSVTVDQPLDQGPQPLNFVYNGQPASLNLQDHLPGQLPEATVIRPVLPTAPPAPNFTFNGQPASLVPGSAPITTDSVSANVAPDVAPAVPESGSGAIPSDPLKSDVTENAAAMLEAMPATPETAPPVPDFTFNGQSAPLKPAPAQMSTDPVSANVEPDVAPAVPESGSGAIPSDFLKSDVPENAAAVLEAMPATAQAAPPVPNFTFNGQPASLRPAPVQMSADPVSANVEPEVAPAVLESGSGAIPSDPLKSDVLEAAPTMQEALPVSSEVTKVAPSDPISTVQSVQAAPAVKTSANGISRWIENVAAFLPSRFRSKNATAGSVDLEALSARSQVTQPASSEATSTAKDVEVAPTVTSSVNEPTVVVETASQPLPPVVEVEQEVSGPIEEPIAAKPSEPDAEETPSLDPQDTAAARPLPSKTEAGSSAEVEVDGINVGPRIGVDEPPAKPSDIDKDALLTRITHETQNDNSVLYKLDSEPAFVDRGSRLEMVPGAGTSDEKIMAALLTAARFYRGQIELTGSDAFKTKAIELIAQHQVNVSMKNPAQQLMLDQARKALAVTAQKPDAILGNTPPPFEPVVTSQHELQQAAMPLQPQLRTELVTPEAQSLPEYLFAPDPLSDSAYSGDLQFENHGHAQPDATRESSPSSPDKPKNVEPSVHQPSQAAKDGVTGKVIGFGTAPFRFDPDNQDSVYIKLRTKEGTQTFWGKELAGVIRETRIQEGRMATLRWLGEKDVIVNVPVRDEAGKVARWVEKEAHRNQWSLSLLNGPAVRAGDDQGVKLAAYDAARFAMIQNSVIAQLNLPIEAPPLPGGGLLWVAPNGQGSAKAGDELSALRPVIDSQDAGKLVMSSWAQDGQLDMALYRGDGAYLQGVVRQGDAYQHVLVSLPGHAEAPPMVFNMITEQGLVPIGVGNGINRSNGEAVSREHIAFKLEGDTATRIAKLDFPAEVPPALHHRLGFDERWKDTNTLPKSAPAAAPVAQPGALRPS